MPDLQSQFLKLCLMLPKIRSNIPDSAKRFRQRQIVLWSGLLSLMLNRQKLMNKRLVLG